MARAGDPLSPSERINLGVAYEQDGKPELALREYERAERGSLKATALVYQANLHASQEKPALAERSYRKALKIDPDHLMALNNLAWLLAEENRDLVEAETLIRHALTLHPEPSAPYENTLQTILESKAP
ncbi:MAG: tetratricopeptide repeat protein [Kiritimatiellae bacterium]|nr:tetratricopeptide repeat protein [Kiritimatiellia bacterium]